MDLLGKVSGGACPEAVLRKLLAACRQPLNTEDGILPTKLYTHRWMVKIACAVTLLTFDWSLEMHGACACALSWAYGTGRVSR